MRQLFASVCEEALITEGVICSPKQPLLLRLRTGLAALFLVALLSHQLEVRAANVSPVVSQTSDTDCGLAALTMLLRREASVFTSIAALDMLAAVLIDPTSKRHRSEGYSVRELQTLARAFGYRLVAMRMTLDSFYAGSFPIMAWIDVGDGGHFTLVERVDKGAVVLADPTRGRVSLNQNAWREIWLKDLSGIILRLTAL